MDNRRPPGYFENDAQSDKPEDITSLIEEFPSEYRPSGEWPFSELSPDLMILRKKSGSPSDPLRVKQQLTTDDGCEKNDDSREEKDERPPKGFFPVHQDVDR